MTLQGAAKGGSGVERTAGCTWFAVRHAATSRERDGPRCCVYGGVWCTSGNQIATPTCCRWRLFRHFHKRGGCAQAGTEWSNSQACKEQRRPCCCTATAPTRMMMMIFVLLVCFIFRSSTLVCACLHTRPFDSCVNYINRDVTEIHASTTASSLMTTHHLPSSMSRSITHLRVCLPSVDPFEHVEVA